MNEHDIAIIGMACRIPGADDLETFWRNLRDGVESISFFNREELLAAGHHPQLLDHPSYVPANATIADTEQFDAAFFGYNPNEAALIDPQHRLFLESAMEALEMAGYGAEPYRGTVGVYAGAAGFSSYLMHHLLPSFDGNTATGVVQLMTGSSLDFLPTRVSYKLNLHGPSVNVQTACSTSLVTVHLACQGILGGECSMALAGGVSLAFPQVTGYLSEAGLLSSDGHCRAFDAEATGVLRGNGLAIVVLKRLADALEDGDTVHAVIKGTAINNDGSEKVGFTAPSIDGQAAVIGEALEIADVDPETITYVETHGTGTDLGDPIEVSGLTQAHRLLGSEARQTCAIGSLKSNVGHLDSAAGAASLIKTVLALQHRSIPPSLHFKTPNPKIDFAASPFYVNAALADWPADETPRRAGVSSFGLGGTNAHVIVEEAPPLPASDASRGVSLLLLSAKTSTALDTATEALHDHLQAHPDQDLTDIAYTLQVGRQAFEHRRMTVCQNREQAIARLSPDSPPPATAVAPSSEVSIAFMFPGAGAQYVAMGQDLYNSEPVFRQHIDRCSEWLRPHLDLDLRELLYRPTDPDRAAAKLKQPILALPALFMTEYALARLWMSWGFQPRAMIGLSLGEYVAACLAGVFSLEDALALVQRRAELIETLPAGAMLSIAAGAEEVQQRLNAEVLDAELSVALVNTPSSCVVAGPVAAIDTLETRLKASNTDYRRLQVAGAGHCAMMDPIMEPFEQLVASLSLNPPQVPYVSNLTGTWITAAEATDPEYWVRHLRQTVRFSDNLETLLEEPNQILLEVGPGRSLAALAQGHSAHQGQPVLTSLRHPKEEKSDLAFILDTLGRLWLAGATIDWNDFYGEERRRRVPLPTYPFERQKYWVESQKRDVPQRSLGKKPDIADWFYRPSWKQATPAALCPRTSEAEAPGHWLIFADELGWAFQLAERLEHQGHRVTLVRAGAAFARPNDRELLIAPQRPEDYSSLIDELHRMDRRPSEILHAWGLIGDPPSGDTAMFERTEHAQVHGFNSLVFLTQALDAKGWADGLTLSILSDNLHDVIGEAWSCPEKALTLGPARVIPHEYPNISCRSIDMILPEPDGPLAARLIEQLLNELKSETSELLVAYRGPHRFTLSYEPMRLEATRQPTRLRPHGVYLIVGGLGGVGLALAEYLTEQVQARLILVGRTPLPERATWSQRLADSGEDDAIAQKIRRIQALEAAGAEVDVQTADVADEAQMRRVVEQARARFGTVHGAIHAAVALEPGVILQKTPQALASSLAAKVQGTVVLDSVLADEPLDFMVYCSSLTGIFGFFGYVDYTAANLFQDAYAKYRTATTGQPTVSIDWDRWLHIGGSTLAFEEMFERLTGEAIVGMTAHEGAEAFQRIVDHPELSHVLVSIQDFGALQARSMTRQDELTPESPDAPQIHGRPELTTAYRAPETDTEIILVGIYQTLLGIEQVGVDDDFFELGGHSLLGTRVISQIRESFQQEVSLRSLFEHRTVAALTKHVDELVLAQKIRTPTEAPAEPRDIGRL